MNYVRNFNFVNLFLIDYFELAFFGSLAHPMGLVS